MRVVFMGTPEFAVPTLEALGRTHEVVGVYTRPDAVRGRGKKLVPSAVKEHALRLGTPVLDPTSLKDPEQHTQLARLSPDIIVVAAYGLILPREILEIPMHGAVNVHASLLPRWRGAAPIQRAILAGDAIAGVSIMKMEPGLDTGPYCVVERVPIEDMNADQLTATLGQIGAQALVRALDLMERGECHWTKQDDSLATYADKVTREDVALDPSAPANVLARRVRASGASAPSRARVASRPLTVLDAHVAAEAVDPGAVRVARDGVLLGTPDGTLLVTRVKPDGKGDMAAADWARGARVGPSDTWSADA
ncbi:MAG: methionyl-tRNA formyltransferase [Coriobacteriales bacterium]|nr:methionyl-tRNA formyltransferase [Coriobacteriales bacterium]